MSFFIAYSLELSSCYTNQLTCIQSTLKGKTYRATFELTAAGGERPQAVDFWVFPLMEATIMMELAIKPVMTHEKGQAVVAHSLFHQCLELFGPVDQQEGAEELSIRAQRSVAVVGPLGEPMSCSDVLTSEALKIADSLKDDFWGNDSVEFRSGDKLCVVIEKTEQRRPVQQIDDFGHGDGSSLSSVLNLTAIHNNLDLPWIVDDKLVLCVRIGHVLMSHPQPRRVTNE